MVQVLLFERKEEIISQVGSELQVKEQEGKSFNINLITDLQMRKLILIQIPILNK